MLIEKYFSIDRKNAQDLINATKDMTNGKSGDNGFQNTKVFLFKEYAVLKMQNMNFRNVTVNDNSLKHLERLAGTLLDLQSQGVNTVPVSAFQSNDGSGYIIQPRAKGTELYDRHKLNDKSYVLKQVELLSLAPQEHFDKFVADTVKIINAGVSVDFMGKDNFFYHKVIGFQFIDLNAHNDYEYGLTDFKPDGLQTAAYYCFLPCYFDTAPQHRDTVSELLPELTGEEYTFLIEHNRIIFNKCIAAMMNNGITKELIDEVLSNDRIIPQKKLLELV